MHNRIRQWFRKEDGGALAEFAIMVFLVLMLAGVSEFGRYFQNYTTLAKATRNASRYLSNHD
jgi:Flp pilus assembly protein TadG